VLPREVANYYAGCGLIVELPLTLPCLMDSFGVITRKGWLLSPASQLMRDALEDAKVQAERSPQVAASAVQR
jgi:DNA-binding transcriptional LysR family regulator